MSALREILAVFDIAVNAEQLDAADKKLDSFTDKLKGIAKAFAAFKIVQSIVNFGEAVAHSAREVEFNAARMEMGVDEYQRLSQVANNYGMTMEQLQIANTLFTRSLMRTGGVMGEFGGHTGQAQAAMKSLHLDAHQFRGQKLEQILPTISDAMLKIKDPMERLGVGILLFGHRGRAILPMMAQGGDNLRRQFAAAVPVFEQLTIDSADRATISAKGLSRVWDNLIFNSFGRALLDASTRVTDALTKVVMWLKELAKNSEIGRGVLYSLIIVMSAAAGAIVAAWWPVLLPILAIIAAFAALALIIDDIIVFMEGGHSVIGDFLDAQFGKGSADQFRKDLETVWDKLKAFVTWVKDAVVDWRHFFDFTWIDQMIAKLEKMQGIVGYFARAAHSLSETFLPGTNTGARANTPEEYDAQMARVTKEGLGYAPTSVLPKDHWSSIPETANGANAGTGSMLNPNYHFNLYNPIDGPALAGKLKDVAGAHHDAALRDALGAVGGPK